MHFDVEFIPNFTDITIRSAASTGVGVLYVPQASIQDRSVGPSKYNIVIILTAVFNWFTFSVSAFLLINTIHKVYDNCEVYSNMLDVIFLKIF